MKRVLSIDFDYFIDTDSNTRSCNFPDGVDNLEKEVNDLIWSSHYKTYPELHNIGVIPEYFLFKEWLKSIPIKYPSIIGESHSDIVKVFNKTRLTELISVVNIDFHHDNYIYGGDTLTCGNWVRFLMNDRPDTDFLWVRREDSELKSLSGPFPYPETTDISCCLKDGYDYVFLCFSPEWTPPHLRDYFIELCKLVDRFY